jgi:hypothetical protein
MALCTLSLSVTSVLLNNVAALSSAANATPASSFKSAITTRPPVATNRRTQAAPKPELPPVTKNVLSLIFIDPLPSKM